MSKFFADKKSVLKEAFLLLLLILVSSYSSAQLSDLHYLPPLKQGQNNQAIRQQAIYLSTPEPTTFTVNAYQGTNPTPVASFNISNTAPATYNLPNGDNNITLVTNANTGIVLQNSGLRFESPSGNRFYVNYRGVSNAQAASLTSKGRVSMGTRFKWGGLPNLGAHNSKSNTLGIMATEDNTTIDIFGYDPDCEFRLGNNVGGLTDDTYQITLNANESFVFETYLAQSPAHVDGWIGASIVSDKDIVISNGGLNTGRQANSGNRDAAIDQPVPENRLGKEYVFVRGNGGTNGATEFPLIIAIADNTQIFVNGSATPIATLNNGDYFQIPSNYYSSNTVGANMYVTTSKDVYAYQSMAGGSQIYTHGLNFVAPVNCLLPDVMDNIPNIRDMAGTLVNGGVTIIASTSTPNGNITVNDGNGNVTLPAPQAVAGTTDWKTFFIPNLTGDVSVQSTGPIAVGFFGLNGARGVAGYFSGFDTVPVVNLQIVGGSGCFVGSNIMEATGNFDAYQWYGDGVLIPGANGQTYAPTVAGDYFVRGTKGPCTYDSQSISAFYCDPDIVVNKTVDIPEIMEGETAVFTIRVQNLSAGPVTNLVVTDNIPAGLTLQSSSTISGSWSGNSWNIGTLGPGETAFLELTVIADEIDSLPLLRLANVAINNQDQTDANITQDEPAALLTVHNDYDNDGVNDTADLDDDNDGIYDTDECNPALINIATGGNVTMSSTISGGSAANAIDNNTDGIFGNGSVAETDTSSSNEWVTLDLGSSQFIDEVIIWNRTDCCSDRLTNAYLMVSDNAFPSNTNLQDALANATFAFQLGNTTGLIDIPVYLATSARYIRIQKSGLNVNGDALSIAEFQVLQGATCDTDGDGESDLHDLDSDNDGCSDANEYYKDDTIDGGDGGEYGTGTPVVDPVDGTVTAASYVAVVAPQIILSNTTEDLGGNDITGQGVNLGQTINYVLRFQNTGDDHAVNFSIEDILPQNVSLDNVDVTNAPGTSYNHILATNVLEFSIPDNLVEIGDPQYSIRITATISGNCADFVAACASQLENLAYVTYEGVANPQVFTNDPNVNPITNCTQLAQVANNTILDDLASCSTARTVELCGNDVVLSAGAGFSIYNWVLDINNNGQVDASDTPLNDGDPDGDPSTLLVTNIGTYIVEKSGGGGCPDMVERINVERFGNTQTNPIIDYFNQVNADSNPDNDLQGEIVTCAIDGDLLPKIFLCGLNDTAEIQLGITDAQSIIWEQLDETSCTDAGDDCGNKNAACNWNMVDNQNSVTITDSGRYRVVINYQNGCFSRFYFNVFKNNLDITYTQRDILCTTPGNISINNLGGGYGFQLLDAVTNNILIPYSANNGPSFDLITSGTYKVQITQLDPLNGTPLPNSCVFETSDIGILDLNFQVNVSSTPANCNQLGQISIQALNALPNYSYELRLDDGSNGGLGSLVDNQLATADNTHIFNSVNPGNYIVNTNTDDGCVDSQNITVGDIPDPTLTAVTTANITCASGIVSLTPSGGFPNPDYQLAIWSKDGIDLYPDPGSIPASALQTNTNFLFGYRGNPLVYYPNENGDYTFIAIDDNGCYAISNIVRVEDLGTVAISATNTPITCADSATATLTVAASGGTAPYQYSLDGGTNYQSGDTFANLAAGQYTITVMDSSGGAGTGCISTMDYTILQPFRLTASAAITETESCNAGNGAEVKILNPIGGQAPYEFSFDGGSNFAASNSAELLPGSYQLVLRDALGCTHEMDITVPSLPLDPDFSSNINYACDGSGSITITPSNTTDFTYTYALDGTLNTPVDNNTFTNVTDGTYTVTVGYSSNILPGQSALLSENFGAGPTTEIAEIGPGYCFEPQDGSVTPCNYGPASILVNGEYAVTSLVTNPISGWQSPNDHTGLTNGRFLMIDISTVPGDNNILWARRNLEVLPNRDISISLWAYNMLRTTANGNNPDILIELVDTSGIVVASTTTGEVPKNSNPDDWHNFILNLNPGSNTSIDIVFRTNLNSDFGNDLVLDDIEAYQIPEVCETTQDIAIVVEADRQFSASLLSSIDPSCNGGSDGAIQFEVTNFSALDGFEYSLDAGVNWTLAMNSPVTSPANLIDGNYTVLVRKVDDNSCTSNFNASLSAPAAISVSLVQTADYTCFNSGATLEASATGGTPAYDYQLEDTIGNIVMAYQANNTFNNVTDGDYLIRVRDQNGCESLSAVALTVTPPATVLFNLTATSCYDGLNNASITANVTAGNGNYSFRINGGAWNIPSPANATSYTFSGLSDGSYDIEVMDQFGCAAVLQTNTINPQLIGVATVTDVSTCSDGNISVIATGGDGNYAYAFIPSGNTILDSDFGPANSFNVASAATGNYDVYVRDNNGIATACESMQTVSVGTSPPITFTATPTNPQCFGGTGSIEVNITSGLAPYTYILVDNDHGGAANQTDTNVLSTTRNYFNLLPGTYDLTITDATGCSQVITAITLTEPDELVADLEGVLPASCSSIDPNDYGFRFLNYPATLGIIEFSADGGSSWTGDNSNPGVSDVLTGYLSGTNVYPSMRTVDGMGNTLCQVDLPRYTIPYPLDDLDITISTIVVNCNELQVTVQGTEGVPPYEYAYSDDPANFNVATAGWTASTPGSYVWTGLVPGRTYVFYVRDNSGCIRQSNVNVNDITTNPMEITATYEPSCNGANDGEITYNIVDTDGLIEPQMNWELYDINSNLISSSGGNIPYSSTLTITGLASNEYHIVIEQVDVANNPQCISGSENLILEELDVTTANLNVIQHISCESPGLISIDNILGGGGTYNYTVSGPVPFTTISGTTDNPVEIAVGSPAGAYHVDINDQYGCSYSLGSINLNVSPDPVIDNVTIDNCGPNATVNITASSVSGTILYSLDGGITYLNNGGIFNNISAGTYTISIKDGNGCTVSQPITIHPTLQATASLTKSLGCGPGGDAEITLEVISGSTNFDYEVTDTSGTVMARQAMASNPLVIALSLPETYTIKVFDNNTSLPECNRSFDIVVPPATQPDFTANHTDITCNGYTDGTISLIEVNNGTNPLNYSILPNLGTFNAATATYENLPAGLYSVTATGTNGCTASINNIQISEPGLISFTTPSVVPFGCATGNNTQNATVTLDPSSITGGSTNYVRYEFVHTASNTVLQDGTNPVLIYTDVLGADITINVYDDQGCLGQDTVTIPAFDEILSASVAINDNILCTNAGEDIQINLTGSITNNTSHPGNYEYRLLPSVSYQASNQFTDLQPGSYSFGVRNTATGCEVILSHTVSNPNTFNLIVDKISDAVCFGDNGSITLEITDVTYTGGFTWSIFDTNGTPADRTDDGPAILTGVSTNMGPTAPIAVPGGNYLVEVNQAGAPGCNQLRSFNIVTPTAPISVSATELAGVGCSDDQGSILIDPQGGIGPYNITITNISAGGSFNINGVNTHIFNALSSGQYDISITDASGCSTTYSNAFQLILPDPISATINNTNLVCQGDNDASVSINLSPRNVSPNYSFVLNRYDDAIGSLLLQSTASQPTQSFDNLGPGFYSITVTDDMGCSLETIIVEIAEPSEVTSLLVKTQNLSCTSDAILSISAFGGTGPYSWSVDGINFNAMNNLDGPDTHQFQNITPGSYAYFIRDSFNCVSVLSNRIDIDPLSPLVVTVDTSAANINCSGESTAVISADADGGLGNYQYALFSDAALSNELQSNQSSGLFTNLPAGSYYIRVQSDDCETVSTEVVITDPVPLSVTADISDISCSGVDDGRIILNVNGGSGNYQYAISPNLNQFDDTNSFEGLAPGNYRLIAQDALGCFEVIDVTLTEPTPLDVSSMVTNEVCLGSSDGTIALTINGGTAPYFTSLNSNSDSDFVQDINSYNNLPSGTHVVFIRDSNGCEIYEVFDVEAGVNLTGEAQVIYECDPVGITRNSVQVVFEDSSVATDVLYGLDTSDPALMQLEPAFSNLSAGSHTITAVHSNGCINTFDLEILEFEPLTMELIESNLNQIQAIVSGGSGNYLFSYNEGSETDSDTHYIRETGIHTVTVTDENGCSITQEIFMEFIDVEFPNFFTPDGDGQNDRWTPRNIEPYPNIFVKVYDRYGRQVYRFKDNQDGWDGFYQENELPTGDYWFIAKLNGESDQREFVGHFTLYR